MFDIGGRLMNDLISEFGISKAQAAGVVGNLAHESAGFNTLQEIDPLIEGSRGGFGYAQWTGPRRKQFEDWTASQGLDPNSYEANKGFLFHELKETPEGRVLDSLKQTSTAEEAAQVFSDDFLRPGIPHIDSRIELAQKFDGGSDDILIGGQGSDTMTAFERAREKLMRTPGIVPEETEDLIVIGPEKTMSQKMRDAGGTLLRQSLQGATFGFADEVTDRIGAGIASAVTGVPYNDMLLEARETTKEDLKRDWEEAPVLSTVANVGGGLLTGGGLVSGAKTLAPKATGALINVAKSAPRTTAILTGAGGTGLYSAGEAEGPVTERLDDFGVGALYGGPLGYGGYKLAKGVGNVGSAAVEKYGPAIAPYLQKAQDAVSPVFKKTTRRAGAAADDLIAPATQQADDVSLTQMAGILDEDDLARLEQGNTIPLTKGDRTQDVAIQRAEQIAAEAGSEPILNARAQQAAAARKPFVKALGDEAENAQDIDLRLMEQMEAENAANLLRGNYDSLKGKENAAWRAAREAGEGVGIRGTSVNDDFINPVRNILKEREYRTGDIPQLDKHIPGS